MRQPIAAGLLALISVVYAQVNTQCKDSVCYGLNIPASTASQGTGDIFISIKAPTSMSWAALGQGSGMVGANMFVMYTDSSGRNVTVSPRLASGHVEPDFNSDARIELLAGSGVSGGNMVANFRCSSCNNWDGGSANFRGSAGSWVYAYKSGDAINSDSTSASISEHDDMGPFSFSYASANGGNSANPFVTSGTSSRCGSRSSGSGVSTATAASASGGSSTPATATGAAPPWASYFSSKFGGSQPTGNPFSNDNDFNKRQTSTDDDDSCVEDAGDGDGNGDSGTTSTDGFQNAGSGFFRGNRPQQFYMAHGILAALAMVIFLPIGAIIIRLLSFPGLIWLHAAMQIVGYMMFIAAFGLGIYIANEQDLLDEYHPIIGIVIFILIFFQPLLGMMHHQLYKKYQHRTFWSYGHIWMGRIIITLGIINGGLGLKLSDNTRGGEIAYGVVAGIIWLIYIISAVYGELKRKRAAAAADLPPKYSESPPMTQQQSRQPQQEQYAPAAVPHDSEYAAPRNSEQTPVSPIEYYNEGPPSAHPKP